jgi:hypothetical protein
VSVENGKPGKIYVRNGKNPVATAFAFEMANRFVSAGYNHERLVHLGFTNRRGKTAFDVLLAKFTIEDDRECAEYAAAVRTGVAAIIDQAIAEYHHQRARAADHYEDENE